MAKNLSEIISEDKYEEIEYNPKYPVRDYEKQKECEHIGFKMFLKCGCSLALGENSLDEVIEILIRERDRQGKKKLTVHQI